MKKALSVLLCVCALLCLLCPVPALAHASPVIAVDSKTAVAGDTVNIGVEISENRGIMAMTFSINYDPSVLSFLGYGKGYLTDYTVFDDKQNRKINFVNCEDTDVAKDGNIVILQFSVNQDAPKGFSAITISPINSEQGESLKGCFARSDSESVIPSIVSGGVTVGTPCVDAPHKFSDFSFEVKPTCTNGGLKSRSCSLCGHTQSETVEPLGHDFEDFWTVDRKATADMSGILSRHCKRCDSKTDVFSFESTDAQNGGIHNTEQSKISPDVLERLEKFAALLQGGLQNQPEQDDSSHEPFFNPPEQDNSQYTDARELIDSRGRININLMLEKMYEYLFGNQEKRGILSVIGEYFTEVFQSANLSPWLLILLLFVI